MPSFTWSPSNTEASALITTKTTYSSSAVVDVLDGGITVRYRPNTSGTATTEQFTADTLYMELTPNDNQVLVDGTARFRVTGRAYADQAGRLLSNIDAATGAGLDSGDIDMSTGLATITQWTAGTPAPSLDALLTTLGDVVASDFVFMAPTRPLAPGSAQILATTIGGTDISVQVPTTGIIASSLLSGIVNAHQGIFHLRFGYWKTLESGDELLWQYIAEHIRESDNKIWWPVPIRAKTLRVNATAISYLPVDASEIGINPSAFPGNGLVQIFEKAADVVIHHEAHDAMAGPIAPGSVYDAGRNRLYRVRVTDANGLDVPASATTWTEHRTDEAGLLGVQFALVASLNLTPYVQPFTLHHQVLDRNRVLDVDLSGLVTLERPVSHVFPVGSHISRALPLGNMLVSLPVSFTQATWTSVWSDSRIGSEPIMQYQSALFPIELTNDGAITDRWVFVMQSATTFRCFSEALGEVGTSLGSPHSISADFIPTNPLTGKAYFSARAGLLGAGGATGECFRFNTVGAARGIWPIVSVLPGNSLVSADQFKVQIIGNAEGS